MGTWNDTTEYNDYGLLPEGKQRLHIIAARVELNPHTGREDAVLELESANGVIGFVNLPLEPWSADAEQFERLFKTNGVGLGFRPARGDASIGDLVDEFAEYITGIVGMAVDTRIEHTESKTLKEDGTPFINHRVRFRGLVGAPVALSSARDMAAV